MADLLQKAKNRIDKKFLGHKGIHGVGLRRSENAVVIYLDPAHPAKGRELLTKVRSLAAPFGIIVVKSAPAVGF